ncbi:MAG: tetratricopeptide repeat protein [Ignavibacteria bacterium]|nr:tetratricopeptide repeat protein [Ignavibacteria bacterium]
MTLRVLVASIVLLFGSTLFLLGQDQLSYAKAYEQSGDLRSAARIYLELFDASPTNAAAFEGLVRTFDGLKQYSGLLPLIEKRFKAVPSRTTALLASAACLKIGKVEAAEQWWSKVRDLGNDGSAAWAAIARQQSEFFLNDRAIASYLTARSKSDDDLDFALELSLLYSTTGQVAKAAEEILKAHQQQGELALTYGRLSALMTSDTASTAVGSVIMSATNIAEINFIKQWYYRHTGQWEQALIITKELDAESGQRGSEMLMFADAARAEGAYDVAIQAYGLLIDSGGDRHVSLSAAYGIAQTLDQKVRSAQTIDKAVATAVVERYNSIAAAYSEHPLSADAMYRAAVLMDDVLGKTREAIELLTKLINRWSGTTASVDGALRLADLYLSVDQVEGALSALAVADADRNPMNSERRDLARLRRADIVLFQGNKDSARSMYASLAASPGSPAANDALEKIALLMLEQDDSVGVNGIVRGLHALSRRKTEEASRIFVATVSEARDNEIRDRSRIEAAQCFVKLGQQEAADSQLVAILDRIPDTIYGDKALIITADVLERRGDVQGAIAALTSLLVQYPRSILAPSARERIRKLRGDA